MSRVFTDDMAELAKAHAGEKYRPSNGTEGEMFYRAWCYRCQRDKAMSQGCDFDQCDDDDLCKIVGDTMAFDVDDPRYPIEWSYGPDGHPRCTAFVPAGEATPASRCERTMDLFGEAPE